LLLKLLLLRRTDLNTPGLYATATGVCILPERVSQKVFVCERVSPAVARELLTGGRESVACILLYAIRSKQQARSCTSTEKADVLESLMIS